MKILREILLKSTDYLKNKGIPNPRLDVEHIISHFLSIKRMEIYLQFEREIVDPELSLIKNAIIERGKRIPLQYITRSVHFLDAKIKVNEHVLIPRPETEYMTDFILNNDLIAHRDTRWCILDLCTGSGAIAIAIKMRHDDLRVTATDISSEALAIARENATSNGVQIDFFHADLFQKLTPDISGQKASAGYCSHDPKYHLIVSNPPYISHAQYRTLAPEIFHEPKLALLSDEGGLSFYEKIVAQAQSHLHENGILYLEIGETQAEAVSQIASKYNYQSIHVIPDLNQRDRIVRLVK
jgi:release factor glutamine methyltransferase